MQKISPVKEQSFNKIGKNSTLIGNFHFSGPTFISGEIEGEIKIDDMAQLYLEFGCKMNGKIFCHHLIIAGEFKGEINSTGTVHLYPSANLIGTISCNQLKIEPGAFIEFTGHTINTVQ